jgi:hypothetical protein
MLGATRKLLDAADAVLYGIGYEDMTEAQQGLQRAIDGLERLGITGKVRT